MTVLKDKYGREVADTKDFEDKGFGEFGKHIRATVDENWGIKSQDNKIKHYEVSISGTASVFTIVKVWAYDEEEAEDEALRVVSDWDFEISDIEEKEVVDIEEKEGEE